MKAESTQGSRSVIIDAAVRLFGKQSYTATSMRDIAKEVGVLPGSLYAHIQSKEDLLVEVVEMGIASFLRAVEPFAEKAGPPEERMRGAIKAHVEVVAENPGRSLVVFHQWRFLTDARLADAVAKRRRYERIFTRIMDDGIAAGVFAVPHRRVAVFSILGAVNWVPEWYSERGADSALRIGDMIADTLISGIRRQA